MLLGNTAHLLNYRAGVFVLLPTDSRIDRAAVPELFQNCIMGVEGFDGNTTGLFLFSLVMLHQKKKNVFCVSTA